jgi:3-deoxy-7-phosphoheptulonate synthase
MNIAGKLSLDDLPRICPSLSRRTNQRYGRGETRIVDVLGVKFGSSMPVMIAGPCAVESRKQTLEIAMAVKQAGARMLRGGAYKPRTAPHDFQGLALEGLKILREASELTGLPVVTEVLDIRLVDQVAKHADMLQIGSRNMQNYPLLVEAGKCGKPVLLKRGMGAGLCEWLGAAEYIASEGNLDIVLCERGIKAFSSGEYSRYVLDLNVIPAVQAETFLPVIVDPSHATGVSMMVEPASRAAVEMGAQGLIIEVAMEREGCERPRCDAAQAVAPAAIERLVDWLQDREEYATERQRAAA